MLERVSSEEETVRAPGLLHKRQRDRDHNVAAMRYDGGPVNSKAKREHVQQEMINHREMLFESLTLANEKQRIVRNVGTPPSLRITNVVTGPS